MTSGITAVLAKRSAVNLLARFPRLGRRKRGGRGAAAALALPAMAAGCRRRMGSARKGAGGGRSPHS
jgi:hypothetical protein